MKQTLLGRLTIFSVEGSEKGKMESTAISISDPFVAVAINRSHSEEEISSCCWGNQSSRLLQESIRHEEYLAFHLPKQVWCLSQDPVGLGGYSAFQACGHHKIQMRIQHLEKKNAGACFLKRTAGEPIACTCRDCQRFNNSEHNKLLFSWRFKRGTWKVAMELRE